MTSAFAHACSCSCGHQAPRQRPRRAPRRQPRWAFESKTLLFDRAFRSRILNYLAREEPTLNADTIDFWKKLGDIMTRDVVTAMMRSGFSPEIQAGFSEAWGQYVDRTLSPAWGAALAAAAVASGRADLFATMSIEVIDEWLARRGATAFAGYTARQAQTINTLVRGAVAERLSQRQLAEVLRVSVGLTPQHARAINAQVTAMAEAGATGAQIRTAAAQSAQRYQQVRASMIARTELASALNGGTQVAMEQAVAAGLLVNVERVWAAQNDARTCIICETLNGERTGIGDSFPGGYVIPPAHPRCRCVILYEEVSTP